MSSFDAFKDQQKRLTHKRPVFTKNDCGCLVDGGIRGIYAGARLQRIATTHGWPGQPHYDPYDVDNYDDTNDDALEYLNTLCSDDVMFEWLDGDVVLLPVD